MRFKRLVSVFLPVLFSLSEALPASALSSSNTLRPERTGAEEIAAKLAPAAGAEEHLASYAKFQEWYGVHFIKMAEGAEAAKAPEGPYLATALWDRWRALDEVTRLLRSEKRPSWLSTGRQRVIDLLQDNIKGIAKDYQLHYKVVSGRDDVPQRKSEDEITGLLDRSPADAVWMDLLGRSLSAEKARNLAFPKQGQGVVDSILEVQPVKDKVGPVRIVIYKPDAHIQGLVQMPGLGERGDHLYQLKAKAHPESVASSAILNAKSRADQRQWDDARKGGASSQDPSAAARALLEAQLGKELLEPMIRVVANELPAVRRRWANHPNKDKWPLKAVVNFLAARLRRPADEIEAALAKAVNIRPGQPFAEEADVIALLAEIRALPNLQLQIKGLAPKPAAERIFNFIDRREPLDGDFGRALQRIMAHVLKEPQAKDVQFAKALWLELEKQNPPPPLEDILLAGHPENYHIPRLRWRNLPDRAAAKQKTTELLAARYQQTEQKISNALGRAEAVPAHFAFVTHNDAGAAAKLLIAHFEQHAEAIQRPGGEIALEILRQIDGSIRPEDEMGKTLLGILQRGAEHLQQGEEKAQLADVLWRAAPETLVQGRGMNLKKGGHLYTRNAEVFQIVRWERESEGGKVTIIGRPIVDGQPQATGNRFTPERLFVEDWRYNPPISDANTIVEIPSVETAAGAEEEFRRQVSRLPREQIRPFLWNYWVAGRGDPIPLIIDWYRQPAEWNAQLSPQHGNEIFHWMTEFIYRLPPGDPVYKERLFTFFRETALNPNAWATTRSQAVFGMRLSARTAKEARETLRTADSLWKESWTWTDRREIAKTPVQSSLLDTVSQLKIREAGEWVWGRRLKYTPSKIETVPPTTAGAEENLVLLVVDDQPVNRLLVLAALGSELAGRGIQALEAGSLAEAEVMIQRNPGKKFVAVTDLEMPGGTGLQVASRVKAADPQARVILMTSSSDYATMSASDALKALRSEGAEIDGFVHKPFSIALVKTLVKQHLQDRLAVSAGAEEGSFAVVAVGGVIAAVPAWARGSTLGVTVGFAQTRVVVEMNTLPPDRLVAVAAGAEEAKAIEVLGVPAVQIVESKPVAVRLARGILEVIGGFRQVRVLDAAARTLRELRLWFQELPAAWQGSMSAGVEEQVLQLEDLSQVGV